MRSVFACIQSFRLRRYIHRLKARAIMREERADAEFGSLKRYRIFLFWLLALVYMLPFLQGVISSVVAKDVMRGLGLSPDRMGMLASSYLWSYAVSMLLSGVAASRFSPRRYLAVMYVVAGVGGVLFAYADGLFMACLGRALTGVGMACVMTASMTLFSRWFRGETYAAMCALFFSVGGLGAFLGAAPLAVANTAWGWESCILLVAGLTFLSGLLILICVRDWPPAGSEKALGVSEAPRTPVTLSAMWHSVSVMSRSPDFWKMTLWFATMSGIYQAFPGLWAIPYLKDVHRLTDARAGMLLSLFSLGFIIGNPLLSWLSEKKLHSNRIGLAGGGLAAALFYLIMLIGGERLGDAALTALFLGLGMAHNAPNALVYASARNLFGSRLAGMGSGFMAGSCFISGGLLQMADGWILRTAHERGASDAVAYTLAFGPYVALCLIAAYCGITLSRNSDPGRISPLSWRNVLKHNS